MNGPVLLPGLLAVFFLSFCPSLAFSSSFDFHWCTETPPGHAIDFNCAVARCKVNDYFKLYISVCRAPDIAPDDGLGHLDLSCVRPTCPQQTISDCIKASSGNSRGTDQQYPCEPPYKQNPAHMPPTGLMFVGLNNNTNELPHSDMSPHCDCYQPDCNDVDSQDPSLLCYLFTSLPTQGPVVSVTCEPCVELTSEQSLHSRNASSMQVSFVNSSISCQSREDRSSRHNLLIAGAVGVPLSTMLLLAFVVFSVYALRRRRLRSAPSDSPATSLAVLSRTFLAQSVSDVTTVFNFKELEYATDSFSDNKLLGDGGFGAVYKGTLYDGRKVAVKRLYHDKFGRMEQFSNEIRILSVLAHPNLVKLYGYCCEDSRDLLLVFEYASNGSLADHLHRQTVNALPWKTRLMIAWEVAQALSYLHNAVTPPIFHRDVKSQNILLDHGFHAKLADFGLSRIVPLQASHVSTVPQGTPGYLDPEYRHCYRLTDKSDVYSFGVVLVELVSALPAVDMSRSRGEINLSSLAVSKISCGAWQELLDSRLDSSQEPGLVDMARGVMELSYRCLATEKEVRPDMKAVVQELASIWKSGYGECNLQFTIQISSTGSHRPIAELSFMPVPSPATSSSCYSFHGSGNSDTSQSSPILLHQLPRSS